MAGYRVNNYSPSTADLTSLMATVDGDRTGYVAVSLTEYASTSRPEIAGGSIVEVAGALFRFSTTEAISTASVTSTSAQFYYIEIAPTSSQCSAQFSTTASAWREDLQGYYQSTISNNRHIGKTYFSGTDYISKSLYHYREKYPVDRFHCREEQPSGTAGGAIASTAWFTRSLNTVVTNDIGASLSSYQVTLPPGRYRVFASAPAYYVNAHRCILYNITSGAISIYGSNESSPTANVPSQSRTTINDILYITTTTVFELRHAVSNPTNIPGNAGYFSSFGVNEYYSELIFEKIT